MDLKREISDIGVLGIIFFASLILYVINVGKELKYANFLQAILPLLAADFIFLHFPVNLCVPVGDNLQFKSRTVIKMMLVTNNFYLSQAATGHKIVLKEKMPREFR